VIWESTALMAGFDLVFIAMAVTSILLLMGRWKRLGSPDRGATLVMLGLSVVGLFYLVDLFVLLALPRIIDPAEATAIMEKLHLDYSLIADFLGAAAILTGFTIMIGHIDAASADLRESEACFQGMAESSPVGIFLDDADGNAVFVSPKCAEMVGAPADDCLQMGWVPRIHPDDRERVAREWMRTVGEGAPFSETYRFRHDDGQVVYTQCMAVPVRGEDGEVLHFVGTLIDITARVRAEEELEALTIDLERRVAERAAELEMAHEEIDRMFELSLDLICIADIDGYFRKLNPAWTTTLGYTEEELLGVPYLEFVHPDDREQTLDVIRDVLERGDPVISFENRYRHKDGSYRWLRWASRPDPQRELTYAIARDVTSEKAAAEALQSKYDEQMIRSRVIVDSSSDMLALLDRDCVYLDANPAYAQAVGMTREQMVGLTVADVTGPAFFNEGVRARVDRCLAGEDVHYRGWIDFLPGERKYLDIRYHRTINTTGEVTGFVVSARDATERKLAEERARQQAEQQAVVADLGRAALAGTSLQNLMDDLVERVAPTLGVEFCKVLELLPDGEALLLRSGVGWKRGLVGTATVGAGHDSQAGFILTADETVVVEDLRSETRFSGPALLIDHGVVSGMSVVIRGRDRPFGVIGVHTSTHRAFTDAEAHFLEGLANTLADVIQRIRVEEELRRRSDELARTNAELLGLNRLAVGRELRMIELKREVNELLEAAEHPPAYDTTFAPDELAR